MDNETMARLLAETADLMEIDGADGFRIEATAARLRLPSRRPWTWWRRDGYGAAAGDRRDRQEHGGAICRRLWRPAKLPQRDELLAKYGASMLELLKLPGMGPKTVALLWAAAKVGSVDQLAEAIEAGRLKGLPRMGDKQIQKLRKGIEDYRRSAGRFRIDVADEEAGRIAAYLLGFKGIER